MPFTGGPPEGIPALDPVIPSAASIDKAANPPTFITPSKGERCTDEAIDQPDEVSRFCLKANAQSVQRQPLLKAKMGSFFETVRDVFPVN
jgi:hypothetical protein